MRYILLLSLFISSTAFGATTGPRRLVLPSIQLLTNETLAAGRSFTISGNTAKGFGILAVDIELVDADASTTALNMSCTTATGAALQACTTAAGVCTSKDASWTKDPKTDSQLHWVWRVDIEGLGQSGIICAITDTAGTADDLISAIGTLSVKGG